KTVIALMCGVLVAGLVCLAVGLITYFTANGNAISVIIGMFTIAGGGVIAAAATLVLIIILIVSAVIKKRNDK
ncbi:MAG: hypothetical protein K2L72_02800, partial [Clostridia bacterium]|nr:hypothetical protein [Clostridia bacterium]